MCGHTIFSLPGRSPGRAIVLPPALASAALASAAANLSSGVSKKFHVKVFYVMGEALSGELSCPCDRSCLNIYISATIGQTPSILGT